MIKVAILYLQGVKMFTDREHDLLAWWRLLGYSALFVAVYSVALWIAVRVG